jgi:hypothetical protein
MIEQVRRAKRMIGNGARNWRDERGVVAILGAAGALFGNQRGELAFRGGDRVVEVDA